MDRKTKTQPLNNGLTTEQIEKAKEVFRKVCKAQVCKEAGVKVDTLNNVLRGTSSHVEDLKKALVVANRIVKRKEQTIKALPL